MRASLRCALLCFLALALLVPGIAAASGPGSTVLVSRPDGLGSSPAAFENSSQTPGAVSENGRYAAFVSSADGFAPGADPDVQNIFLRDTLTGTTTLVSRSDGLDGPGANSSSQNPDIA